MKIIIATMHETDNATSPMKVRNKKPLIVKISSTKSVAMALADDGARDFTACWKRLTYIPPVHSGLPPLVQWSVVLGRDAVRAIGLASAVRRRCANEVPAIRK